MGKGDGKTKKKKKSKNKSVDTIDGSDDNGNDNDNGSNVPAPQRVTSNSLMSVRRQIEYAKLKKQMVRSSQTSFRATHRTSYRKKGPIGPDELAEARAKRKEKAQDDWAIWTNSTSSPLMIVDGYNVIYQWPRLKKHMTNGNLKRARELLVDDMEELRAIKGWRIEIVFDGRGRSLKGVLGDNVGGERVTVGDTRTKSEEISKGVKVSYSGIGVSADTYIEARCFEAKKVTKGAMTGSMMVVSDDNMIRVAGVSAGAVLMSSGRLVDELKTVRKAVLYRIEAALARESGGPMRHSSLHGKQEKTTFKMGKVEIVDKRNSTNTRQERWRRKVAKRNAKMGINGDDNDRFDGGDNDGDTKGSITRTIRVGGPLEDDANESLLLEQQRKDARAKKLEVLEKLIQQYNLKANGTYSSKETLNEYYTSQHRDEEFRFKEQFVTKSNASKKWNSDFFCPITKQFFSSGLLGDPERYTIDQDTHEVWFVSKAEAEQAAAHNALKFLLKQDR